MSRHYLTWPEVYSYYRLERGCTPEGAVARANDWLKRKRAAERSAIKQAGRKKNPA